MEGWKVVLSKEEIQNYVKKCADVLNQSFKDQDVVVACILKGAAYFYVDLTRQLSFEHSCYFIEASSYKDGEIQGEELEILSVINPDKFNGKKVILVDELYDNGKTLYLVKNAITEKTSLTLSDIFTCTLFRKDKETEYPKPNLYGIMVPNIWLAGYGLDNQQKMRNLEALYGKI